MKTERYYCDRCAQDITDAVRSWNKKATKMKRIWRDSPTGWILKWDLDSRDYCLCRKCEVGLLKYLGDKPEIDSKDE